MCGILPVLLFILFQLKTGNCNGEMMPNLVHDRVLVGSSKSAGFHFVAPLNFTIVGLRITSESEATKMTNEEASFEILRLLDGTWGTGSMASLRWVQLDQNIGPESTPITPVSILSGWKVGIVGSRNCKSLDLGIFPDIRNIGGVPTPLGSLLGSTCLDTTSIAASGPSFIDQSKGGRPEMYYCKENCVSCVIWDQCAECASGFYLHEENCYDNCQVIAPTCINDDSTIPPQCSCSDCLVENCDVCYPNGTCNLCESLPVKYYIFEEECISDCSTKGAFYPSGSICRPCDDENCVECLGESSCSLCNSSLYLLNSESCVSDCTIYGLVPNNTTMKCMVANLTCQIDNCNTCKNSTVCAECYSFYYLLGSMCVSDCGFGMWESDVSSPPSCHPCPQSGCEDCSGRFDGECTSCSSGNLVNGYCCEVSNCANCASDVAVCTTCSFGFYGDGTSSCTTCPQTNCVDCSGGLDGDCLLCSSGTLSSGYCCTMENCENCANDLSLCTKCYSGFYGNGTSTCTACPQLLCAECSSGIDDACTSCSGGILINGYCCAMGHCDDCSTLQYICDNCLYGFYGDGSASCVSCPQDNCSDCTSGSVGDCVDCSAGFLVSGACCVMDNCIDCSSSVSICNDCDFGFFWDGVDYCESCNQLNCQDCVGGAPSDCSLCADGFFLDVNPSGNCCSKKFCVDCSANRDICSTCDSFHFLDPTGSCCNMDFCDDCSNSSAICEDCSLGYWGDGSSTCSLCQDTNCIECQGAGTGVCLSCVTGYEIVDSECSPVCDSTCLENSKCVEIQELNVCQCLNGFYPEDESVQPVVCIEYGTADDDDDSSSNDDDNDDDDDDKKSNLPMIITLSASGGVLICVVVILLFIIVIVVAIVQKRNKKKMKQMKQNMEMKSNSQGFTIHSLSGSVTGELANPELHDAHTKKAMEALKEMGNIYVVGFDEVKLIKQIDKGGSGAKVVLAEWVTRFFY